MDAYPDRTRVPGTKGEREVREPVADQRDCELDGIGSRLTRSSLQIVARPTTTVILLAKEFRNARRFLAGSFFLMMERAPKDRGSESSAQPFHHAALTRAAALR